MGGGEADAPFAANGYLLGQLPDESLRRYQKSVYAVRERGDQQHADLFGHRLSRNQSGDCPLAKALRNGKHRLAADDGQLRPHTGQLHAREPEKRPRQPL